MISGILDQQRARIRFVPHSLVPGDCDARAFTIGFGLLVVLSITVLYLLYLLPFFLLICFFLVLI
jgi:hypothetical protein